MIAVVLAAGAGSRLRPLTDALPKCLLEVAGQPLIDRIIQGVAAAGLDRLIVVTGHHHQLVESHVRARATVPTTFVHSAKYATTNNAMSLAAARPLIGRAGFVLCDADLCFSANPFPALVAASPESALAVDLAAEWNLEAMKVQLRADGSVARVSKRLSASDSAGESVGVQKIGPADAPALWRAIAQVVAEDPAAAYYEDAFQRMIDDGVRFGVSPVAPRTVLEIDDAADLAAARERFGA